MMLLLSRSLMLVWLWALLVRFHASYHKADSLDICRRSQLSLKHASLLWTLMLFELMVAPCFDFVY